jgi:acetyl esterase/lipase
MTSTRDTAGHAGADTTVVRPGTVVPDLPQIPEPRRTGDRLVHDGVTFARPLGYRPLLMDVHRPVHAPESPRGPIPCVVWIHGGAWWAGDRRHTPGSWPRDDHWFRLLTGAGMAVATIDYRLSGEARYPAQLADAQAAVRYLRHHASAFGIDPARVGVSGESAGGHLAAMVALTGETPVPATDGSVVGPSSAEQAAVPLYPVTDLAAFGPDDTESWDGPTPEDALLGHRVADALEAAAAASPVRHVRADAPPMLLLHGDADTVVPPAHSERLAEALQRVGAPVRLELVAGGEHCFDGADPVPALDAAVAFLAEHLRG